MKKFFVVVLSVVMCFAVMTAFTGCGSSYDDSALQRQIDELQQELAEIKGSGSCKPQVTGTGVLIRRASGE